MAQKLELEYKSTFVFTFVASSFGLFVEQVPVGHRRRFVGRPAEEESPEGSLQRGQADRPLSAGKPDCSLRLRLRICSRKHSLGFV
jgi:hypothetical protein